MPASHVLIKVIPSLATLAVYDNVVLDTAGALRGMASLFWCGNGTLQHEDRLGCGRWQRRFRGFLSGAMSDALPS
jgi:hypothetical protein